MTLERGIIEPNRAPTVSEIEREVLHLDAYGMQASSLLCDLPVDPEKGMAKQDILGPLIDKLAEEGWLYSGAGFFSTVFIKGGLALKLGFKASDTGGMYAAWCRANQNLPGVPQVYSLSKFSGCYVVLMRRYDALDEEWLDDEADDYVPDVDYEYRAIRAAIHCGERTSRRFDTVTTALAIREFFHGIVDFDLHETNVMLSTEGDMIITDPISYGPCSGDYAYYTDDTHTSRGYS